MSIATVHHEGPTMRSAPCLMPPDRPRGHLQLVGEAQRMLAVDFRTGAHDPEFGPQKTSTTALPDAEKWSHRMVLGLLETLAGMRSPTQLERWISLELRERVRRTHATSVRRGARPTHPTRVLRLRVCDDVDGVAEVSAVVHDRGRIRAVALRLVGCDGRWILTELAVG